MKRVALARCLGCLAIGLALSSAHPMGIILSVGMPALTLAQPTRRWSYASALSYYGGALWSIIPGERNFFGSDSSFLNAVVLWIVPVGLILSVVPPLGLIGWASPLTSAGFLFPGSSWLGLAGSAFAMGALAWRPKPTIVVLGGVAVGLNL